MSGLFGQPVNTNTTPSLFGNNNNNAANTNSTAPGPSLFGNTNNNANSNTGPGLFGGGNNNNTANTTSNSFGGANNNTNTTATTSTLFGGANNAATTSPSLFGNNNSQGLSSFGNTTNNANTNQGPSLFGNTTNNANSNQGPSLFGNTQINQPQQQNSTFAERAFDGFAPQQSIVQQLQAGLGQSVAIGINGQIQAELARSRLASVGITGPGQQKTVFDQAKTLITKWDPQSQDTLMQAYLYNGTSSVYAPYYTRNVDEDEKSWETALAEKPEPIEGPSGMQTNFVPILARGFKALGDRVGAQVQHIHELRARLHEMNNSLTTVMNAHQQRISVQLDTARRQHTALSQRCLRLAVKVQILRNRGYALDTAEEGLRKSLLALQKQVLDPTFAGREEEIWARMVALRDRARWLEEECRRIGRQVQEHTHGQQDGGGMLSVPEDVLLKTRKILQDYERQLAHLNKELEDVKGEYAGWEQMLGARR